MDELNKHLTPSAIQTTTNPSSTKEKPFSCVICNKKFGSTATLIRHKAIHGERKFGCVFCGKAFFRKDYLVDHKRRVHKEEEEVMTQPLEEVSFEAEFEDSGEECFDEGEFDVDIDNFEEQCEMSLIEEENVEDAIEVKPFFEEDVEPPNVNEKVAKKPNSADKPFSCDTCSKSYAEKRLLNRHIKIHTGILPFKCLVCGKPYMERSDMTRHMRKVHQVDPAIYKHEIYNSSLNNDSEIVANIKQENVVKLRIDGRSKSLSYILQKYTLSAFRKERMDWIGF